MDRHDRRTKGKTMVLRLNLLKNSSLLQEADLKDIPKDVLDHLIAGDCDNKVMQTKYNKIKKLLGEMAELEVELGKMKIDLLAKQSPKEKRPQHRLDEPLSHPK